MAKTAMVQLRGIRALTQLIDSTIEEDLQQKGLDLMMKLTASPRALSLSCALCGFALIASVSVR
jgi:hypothetical protein